jgi:hypothetical protein
MIHVGIAGHDDYVAMIPTQCLHFGTAGRQECRRFLAGGSRNDTGK